MRVGEGGMSCREEMNGAGKDRGQKQGKRRGEKEKEKRALLGGEAPLRQSHPGA